jgi:hypothetical protein
MEPRRVESYTESFFIEKLTNLKRRELSLSWIIPNSYSFINRAGSNKIFFNTDIHSLDWPWMEWANQKFIFAIFWRFV